MTQTVLCVDPDEDARRETVEHLEAELADMSLSFKTAGRFGGATDALTRDLDAIVTEYELTDGTGFELIEAARESSPDAGCILYTDTDPDSIDTDELRGAVTEYVGKGSLFGTERLAELLRTTIENRTQSSYPLAQNETERLAALQAYDLDKPELLSSLNRITDLAADYFDVDRASINIINEHSQDFMACHGNATEWDTSEREDSICTFTILEDENVMAVEDVTDDPRFESRSDTLIEMGIRSYLGANLVTEAGLVIGPLCVYDDVPRSFSRADRTYLTDLASVAIDIVELHSRLDASTATDGDEQ